MRLFVCGVAVALLGLAGVASARPDRDAPKLTDKEFVAKALSDGLVEVKLGELAEKRARNEKVKEFARTMVKDHTKANKELRELATNFKLAVAAGLGRDQQATYLRLSRLDGADFDRAYMKAMVEDH